MVLFGKWNVKHLSPRKALITGTIVTLMIAVTFMTLVAAASWEVTVNDNGNVATLRTTKTTVGALFDEAGIVLTPEDIVSAAADTPISEARQINITRAFDIRISDMDGEKTVRSALPTVGAVLEQYGITLDENDEIEPAADAQTSADMRIAIARVDVSEVTEEEVIGYETIEENSDSVEKGTTKVMTEGENGLANVTYRVVTKNGQETEREEIAREVVDEPVNKVVAVGTKEPEAAPVTKLASRSGSSAALAGAKVITCRATAYDGSYETLGKTNPRTALGKTPTVGTVAVDPSIIPLGTRMYIETVDGSYVYGECFAGRHGRVGLPCGFVHGVARRGAQLWVQTGSSIHFRLGRNLIGQ